MNRQYLLTLIDYHYWARDRVLAAVATLTSDQYARPLSSSFASVAATLKHLYQAEWIWHERLRGRSPSAWPDLPPLDVAGLRERWAGLERQLREYVSALAEADVDRVMDYRLLNGSPGSSALWHVIVHLVNHGTYHRGQVATMLRQLGAEPPASTDLIAWFREVR